MSNERYRTLIESIPRVSTADGFYNIKLLDAWKSQSRYKLPINADVLLTYTGSRSRYKACVPLSVLCMDGDMSNTCILDETMKLHAVLEEFDVSPQFHSHDYFELTVILDGEAVIDIDNELHSYRKGDAYLLNCNTGHREDSSKSFSAAYLAVSKEYIKSYLHKQPIAAPRSRIARFIADNEKEKGNEDCCYVNFIKHENAPHITSAEDLVLDLLEELISGKPGMHYIVMGLLSRLFAALEDDREYKIESVASGSGREKLLAIAATEYIEQKKSRVTRSELSKALHYNGDYIDQVFRRQRGMSLHDFCIVVCMNEAAHLLRSTSLNVGSIIKQIGYENRTNFYTQFENRFGMTPVEYRNSKSS